MASSAPSAPAYMISLLKRRLATSGSLFPGGDEGAWLVWEPGRWVASGIFDQTISAGERVVEATGSDSLSFHFKQRVPLKLGRSSACDIIINDATVSREHLVFEPVEPSLWRLKVLSSNGSTEVNGQPLAAAAELLLTAPCTIRAGDVRLSYLDSAGFQLRLREQ